MNELSNRGTIEVEVKQRGHSYRAVIDIETPLTPTTETATGTIDESNYPNGAWAGTNIRIHDDGTIEELQGNPFGPIGEIIQVY